MTSPTTCRRACLVWLLVAGGAARGAPPPAQPIAPGVPSPGAGAVQAARFRQPITTLKVSPPPVPLPAVDEPMPGSVLPAPRPPRAEVVVGVPLAVATLEDITRLAFLNSPNLREARAQVAAARGTALQAGLYPNPTINAASPQWAGSQSQFNGFVSQEFVTRNKLGLSRAATQRAVQQAELQFIRTRYDLLTNTRLGFYTVLIAQRRVEVLQNLVDIAGKSREAAERLQRGGEGTAIDAILLRIEQDRAQVSLDNAQTELAGSQRRLAATIGVPEMPLAKLEGDLGAKLPDFEYEALRQGVLSRNALAQIAQVEINRSRYLLRRAEVEPFPNLVAMGGYQHQAERFFNQAIWQMTMTVPLWNQNQGNIRAAQAGVGRSVQQYNRVQNELSGQVAANLSQYLQAQQRVDYYHREILPRAEQIQQISAQAYAQGQFDFLRLLQAQRTLLEANLAYVNSQELRWLAGVTIAGLLQLEQFP